MMKMHKDSIMKAMLTSIAILAMVAGTANAQSLKDGGPAAVNWSGPYVGAFAGYGWLDADQRQTNLGMPAGPFKADGEGGLGGLTLGYNHQIGQMVIGAELEGGYMDITGAGRIPSSDPAHHQKIDIESGFYGLAAARLGFAWDRTLIYGKGGYAVFEGDVGQTTTKPGFVTSRSDNLMGWAYGAGVEQLLSDKISIKFEWMRFDLDQDTAFQKSITDIPVGAEYTNSTDGKIDTLRLGVNVRF
jgi:outer membrane immunogenic protein